MGMQHESAKWRQDDATSDDAPQQQPMRQSAKPIQRRRPDADQKKVRREMARKTAYTAQDFRDTVFDTYERLRAQKPTPAKDWLMGEGMTMTPSPDSVSAQMSDSTTSSAGAASAPSGASASSGSSSTGSGGGSSTAAWFNRGKPEMLAGKGHVCERIGHGPHAADAWLLTVQHGFPLLLCTTHAQAEGHSLPVKEDYVRMASINNAGDRSCQACGFHGAPVLADTGPACRQCGSYSLTKNPLKPTPSREERGEAARTRGRDDFTLATLRTEATQLETNIASSDGRVLLNPGDSIRLPSGQTTRVRQVRRHETSGDHYYVDTDMGTSVMPYSTRVQVVPNDTQQQSLPGYGDPRANSNSLPGQPQASGGSGTPDAGQTCPVCGGKSLNVRGGKASCTRCGFSETMQGSGANTLSFGDSPQMINVRSSLHAPQQTAVARRAAEVYDLMKENSL